VSSYAEPFLDAFARIEKLLRQLACADRTVSFSGLVASTRSVPLVRRFEQDLKEYADLRNAIVHERTDGHPIADPYPATVAAIERIADLLTRPPLAIAIVGAIQVKACKPETAVADAARTMRDGNFSQLPVTDDESLIGLLTAETITRWMAAAMDNDGGVILEDHTVAEALPHTENPDHHWELLSRQATAFDALNLFDRYSSSGWSLDAVLLTETGRTDQTLLSIIPAYDIPRLITAVHP
jgi:predicted transcriptional regulator